MISFTELATILAGTGITTQYGFYSTKPAAPYIEYSVAYSHNFAADNKVAHKINRVDVILYTKTKDLTTEGLVEQAFEDNEIVWEKTESYLSDEKLYEIIYEVDING